MSMLPFISEFYGLQDVEPLVEDSFGLGIFSEDISLPCPNSHTYKHHNSPLGKSGGWQKCYNGSLQIFIDVTQFTPSELTVKTLGKTIVVEGKHKECRDEHGSIQRHFVRKYTLPQDYEAENVVATVSSDGILTVKVLPSPITVINHNERIVPIRRIGPAHLKMKQSKEIKNIDAKIEEIQNIDPKIGNDEAENMETK